MKDTHGMFEFFKKAAMEKLGLSNDDDMSNKKQKKGKLQSDESYKGETDFDACESFRINTYTVIISKLLSELER